MLISPENYRLYMCIQVSSQCETVFICATSHWFKSSQVGVSLWESFFITFEQKDIFQKLQFFCRSLSWYTISMNLNWAKVCKCFSKKSNDYSSFQSIHIKSAKLQNHETAVKSLGKIEILEHEGSKYFTWLTFLVLKRSELMTMLGNNDSEYPLISLIMNFTNKQTQKPAALSLS